MSRQDRPVPGAATAVTTGESQATTGRCSSATGVDTPGSQAARATSTKGTKQVLSARWVRGPLSTDSNDKSQTTSTAKQGVDYDALLSSARRRRRKKKSLYISGVPEEVEKALANRLL